MSEQWPDPESVWQALATIPDPEFGVNIVDLGLIYSVDCTPLEVKVVMTLTTPSCPSGSWIYEGVKDLVSRLAGQKSARVDLVFEPAWTPEMLSEEAKRQLGRV